ncbi:MAG: hypothetical protein JW791_03260 [Nanoarchaeota archaeon]|nr:hypothetical protein [Nanoarchaeota archaeon]
MDLLEQILRPTRDGRGVFNHYFELYESDEVIIIMPELIKGFIAKCFDYSIKNGHEYGGYLYGRRKRYGRREGNDFIIYGISESFTDAKSDEVRLVINEQHLKDMNDKGFDIIGIWHTHKKQGFSEGDINSLIDINYLHKQLPNKCDVELSLAAGPAEYPKEGCQIYQLRYDGRFFSKPKLEIVNNIRFIEDFKLKPGIWLQGEKK